jgi:RNA polymerase sigma-70 factor (ECF subfamily)
MQTVLKLDVDSLIERCRSGDEEAIGLLVQDNQGAIFRLALSILDDPAEADEATQETFLAALRSLGSYRGAASLRTWLFAITINVCRSRLRRGRAWQRVKELFLGGAVSVSGRDEQAAHPEALAVQREAEDAVWQAVQALGEKHRLPVILRYYHDLRVAEIAGVLGISEGTVHSRLSTARDRLRVALSAARAVQTEGQPRWER